MGRLFGILILTSLLVSLNGQVLFDDMGDRQRSADLALQCMRTELQQFSQGIERMVMKKLEGIENIIEEKLSNFQIEQRLLRQEMVSLVTRVDTLLNNSETNNLIKSENVLDDIRNASLYVVEQLSSGEAIHMLRNVERLSQFLSKTYYIAGSDCADILEKYPNTRWKNGVYNVTASSDRSKAVFCDMTTDNGGWTVIQRRVNGLVNFYRNWTEYKNGFGYAYNEYWIGNDMLHKLTSMNPQELRVDMERFNGEKAYAIYSNFSVGDEASKYQLQVTGYSGNAGDSLDYNNNSCHNNDNDQ
ncbi:angiopoietin-4-like isoform X2 [Crassostrea angulata]|uniref:angiopoietin-4-like isoform X2 n=1 Tax=Magallana angulata TaxID=2784310 RepID=UPI0022B20CA6|nr:angiopoietin-4-like isoform X2 [Crassostrea angulata]